MRPVTVPCTRRTPERRTAALEAQIDALKNKVECQKAKKDLALRYLFAATKAKDKPFGLTEVRRSGFLEVAPIAVGGRGGD
jgi:hypothetical protein